MKKCVLITGAASGIGLATAREFALHGHDLILTARREEKLQSIREELTETYTVDVQTLSFDIRHQAECAEAASAIRRPVDILINNAGLAKGLDFIHEGNLEHWEQMIDTNVKGLLYMTRLISPGMVARKSGHIINLCSTAGKEIYPKGNVYCATKFAVDALTKAIRADLYTHGIRVSQVSPGHVEETEFASVRFDGDKQKAAIYADFNPLTSRDVAEAIYFIASRPPHVNIQDILMMGTQQAGSMMVDRTGRKYDLSEE
jgi:NADP-dependent 3-hydroxy acid dehydrogenase YdfG